MEIPISILAKISEYTVKPIGRELGYVFFIHANFQKLKTQVEKLTDTKGSVEGKVLIARRNAKDTKPVVGEWLKTVGDFVGKSEAILANEGGHGRLCSINLVQRYKLSKKARKMVDEALVMKNEGDNFDMASYEVGVPLVVSPVPKVADFLNFGSRKLIVEQIMEALFDDNVHTIGVFGMGGVGKTMLLKEISRKIIEKKSFDEVVTSTISQTPDLKSIQGQLADKLGLNFEQETIEGRARQLRERLKMEKSILVVLDDIWDSIDLETIGIPCVEDHIGCKILFTSRNKHVLSNEMSVNTIFEIEALRNDESWDLFKAMAGEIDEASDVKSTAIQIVNECAGLPIAITTLAKALRKKAPSIWNDALLQLKRDDMDVNIRGMNEKVYLSLKLSYDSLECEEVKLLFLLCSMFPEDFDIDVEELQVYAMGMGFLRGVNTVAQGRCRITKLVDDLISSSLLLPISNYGNNNYVKMHDMVRDVAISISSKNDHIRTLSYVKRSNEEWELDEKFLGDHTAVSLTIQDFHDHDLPKLMLPKVQLLQLKGPYFYNKSVSVEEFFFDGMTEIKGLVLESVKISLSPLSLYSFANIRVLRLHYCRIGSIDMIGELKKLEILDLSESDITEIPTTTCQLTQLKVLNLSSCDELKIIPPNILSKLTKLEELSLKTFDRWEGEEWYEGKENASLSELKYLRHLYALDLTIQDEEIMPKHLFLDELNFEKFHITIGFKRDHRGYYYQNCYSKLLELKMESKSCLDDWIKMLLKRSEAVHLEGSICSKVLNSEVLNANDHFLHLKYLHLTNTSEYQHIIHEKNKVLRKCLSKLEFLCLDMLENLESIIHGRYAVGESSFNNLRDVEVRNCKKLETLFFNSRLDDVLNLEHIHISSCEKIMEVMSIVMENDEEDATNNHIEFTHLKYLSLRCLPRLQKFCSQIEKLGQPSQDNSENPQTSTISNSFFSEQVSLPNLEELSIDDAENLKMIWSNVLIIPNSFSKLKKIYIDSCNNLKTVFPPNMINILTSLNILRIGNCKLLEGIFEVQEPTSSVTTTSPIVLQNLSELELCNLPKLEYVWRKNDPFELLSFVNIKSLRIRKCSKLKRECSLKILKQLETIQIGVRRLREALGKQNSADHHMLEVIQLGDGCELCPKLKSLKLNGYVDYNSIHLPMDIVQILYQLEYFELEGVFIEEIFPTNKILLNPILKKKYQIPSRRGWRLHKLPKLKHLWSSSSGCSQDQDEANSSLLQCLTYLTISECGGLSSLVSSSSSVSFTNLRFLVVDKCHGLNHLLNPSVARSLVQIEHLTITECKRMSSVIEDDDGGEEENDEIIVFNNLQFLKITSCSKLTSFYSGRCIIEFPRLTRIYIKNCPEMKVFSLGIVTTPDTRSEVVCLYGDDGNDKWVPKEKMVEDMNVIITEFWNQNFYTHIPNLFEQQNLEGNQSEHSSSHVEE